MARYRSKNADDIRWNRIRREITRALDTKIQNRREKILDGLLTDAWEKYTKALGEGRSIEIEAAHSNMVDAVVKDLIHDPARLVRSDD